MKVSQGSVWKHTETGDEVMVESLQLPVRSVESSSSSVAIPMSDVRVRAGLYDMYGVLPWETESYTVEDFVESHEFVSKSISEEL